MHCAAGRRTHPRPLEDRREPPVRRGRAALRRLRPLTACRFAHDLPLPALLASACVSVLSMNDADLEHAIRRAGYDIGSETTPSGKSVYAIRDGKRHTRGHATLLSLAQYLGRVESPVLFVDDRTVLERVVSKHAEGHKPFTVRRESCRVALFKQHKYVQLISVAGDPPEVYVVSEDGLRRTSRSNLPLEVVVAFEVSPSPQKHSP